MLRNCPIDCVRESEAERGNAWRREGSSKSIFNELSESAACDKSSAPSANVEGADVSPVRLTR